MVSIPLAPIVSAITMMAQQPSVRGFVQWNASPRLTKEHTRAFVLAEERLQIEATGALQASPWSYRAKVDFFHDALGSSAGSEVREAYGDYAGKGFDARLGRQVVTWGAGDLLFVNDVFPKNWEAFFSGRPLEYLKRGVDGARLNVYGKKASADLVVVPSFRADWMPRPDRFLFPDPFPGVPRDTVEPGASLENIEAGLRLYGQTRGWDTSAYLYRGFTRSPSMRPDALPNPTLVTVFYPRLNVYGFSAQGPLKEGVVSLEAGFYDSPQDRDGRDPAIPNSQAKFLVGYSRALDEDRSFGVQYYAEVMDKHGAYRATLPQGFPTAPRVRQMLTARYTQMRRHQTEQLSLFAFWSPDQGDSLVIPEYSLHVTDQTWLAVGANLFGGKPTTPFGAFGKNDNLYLTVRRSF